MRRLLFLLCSLVLVVIQTAAVTHEHAADTLPAGQQVQTCDLCTGLQASAPPPAAASVSHHAAASLRFLPVAATQFLPSRPAAAHRSRAPPSFRSI